MTEGSTRGTLIQPERSHEDFQKQISSHSLRQCSSVNQLQVMSSVEQSSGCLLPKMFDQKCLICFKRMYGSFRARMVCHEAIFELQRTVVDDGCCSTKRESSVAVGLRTFRVTPFCLKRSVLVPILSTHHTCLDAAPSRSFLVFRRFHAVAEFSSCLQLRRPVDVSAH